MKSIPEKDDTIDIRAFGFTNPQGGTGLSDWEYNERFAGTATVKVNKAWHDYETGWRYIGEAVSADLKSYIAKHAAPNDQRVFFGEFDLAEES